MVKKGSVVVAGAIARRIEAGGHVWALLHWALGFRSMGWDVLFLDRLDSAPGIRASPRVRQFDQLMREFGLGDDYSLDLGPIEPPVGLARTKVRERIRSADFLLNIMGYLEDESLLEAARLRVFLDIDPGFGQMWHNLGLCDLYSAHNRFATVGTALGSEACTIPSCGLDWICTVPPVDLDRWLAPAPAANRYSSVGAWRGPYAPVEYDGVRYGLRAHEFRRFADVPSAVGPPLEIALDISPDDEGDARRLRSGGWCLVDPIEVAGDARSYRDYVLGSRAEFSVAKGMYVQSRSGWFSDRTACYLAAGRPALVQETGLACDLPLGEGLLTFREPEDAVEAVHEIESDWDRHSRAAKALAEAHLDAPRVLERLAFQVTS